MEIGDNMNAFDILRKKEISIDKYISLFKNVSGKGHYLYLEGKVKNIKLSNNLYTAKVLGGNEYNVSILFDNDMNIKDCSCECMYFKDKDKYCKHIFALLESIIETKNIKLIKSLIKENIKTYSKYLDDMKNIMEKYDSLVKNKNIKKEALKLYESKQKIFFNLMERVRYIKRLDYHNLRMLLFDINNSIEHIEYHKNEMEECYQEKYEYELAVKESRRLERLERKREAEEEAKRAAEEDDDSVDWLKDAINMRLANALDLDTLKEVKRRLIADGETTELVDDAIEYREALERHARSQRELEELEKIATPLAKLMILHGINSLLDDKKSKKEDTSYLMPWEQDLVDSGEYEPYHFEEEDMDEDDFYYEDDK